MADAGRYVLACLLFSIFQFCQSSDTARCSFRRARNGHASWNKRQKDYVARVTFHNRVGSSRDRCPFVGWGDDLLCQQPEIYASIRRAYDRGCHDFPVDGWSIAGVLQRRAIWAPKDAATSFDGGFHESIYNGCGCDFRPLVGHVRLAESSSCLQIVLMALGLNSDNGHVYPAGGPWTADSRPCHLFL